MKKQKKTILISKQTHELIKKYCIDNTLKINNWVDKILKEYMEKLNEKIC